MPPMLGPASFYSEGPLVGSLPQPSEGPAMVHWTRRPRSYGLAQLGNRRLAGP